MANGLCYSIRVDLSRQITDPQKNLIFVEFSDALHRIFGDSEIKGGALILSTPLEEGPEQFELHCSFKIS